MKDYKFKGNILQKAWKGQYSSKKLTKPLKRLILKGYSHDIAVKSFKMAFFGITCTSNIDWLMGSLHRN